MLGSFGLYSTLTRKLGGCNVRSGSVGSSTRVWKKIRMNDILKCSFEIIIQDLIIGAHEQKKTPTNFKNVWFLCCIWMCRLKFKVAISNGNFRASIWTPRYGRYWSFIMGWSWISKYVDSLSLRTLTLSWIILHLEVVFVNIYCIILSDALFHGLKEVFKLMN